MLHLKEHLRFDFTEHLKLHKDLHKDNPLVSAIMSAREGTLKMHLRMQ